MSTLRPDAATITHLAERYALGPATGGTHGTLTPVAHGAMGRIWRLDLAAVTAETEPFAVKELFVDHEEAAVRAEVDFTSAAARAGIGVPENLRTVDGGYLHRLPDRLGGARIRVTSWVRGRTVRTGDPGRAEWLGRTLGRLHTLRAPVDGIELDPWYDTCPTTERWEELIDAGAASGQHWATTLRASLPHLAELGSVLRPIDSATVIRCHNDPQSSNTFFDPSTGHYTLLDWENSGPGVPLHELAGALLEWHVPDGEVDADAIRTTMRAYRAAGGADGLTGLADYTSAMAGTLNYVAVLAGQALDNDLPTSERRYASTALDGVLAGLPTIRTLTAVRRASQAA